LFRDFQTTADQQSLFEVVDRESWKVWLAWRLRGRSATPGTLRRPKPGIETLTPLAAERGARGAAGRAG